MIHKISGRISSLRKERNLSQEELASLLNVSRQTVSKWETGDTLPDILNAVALAKLFHVTTDSLILGTSKSYMGNTYAGSLREQRKKINLRAIIVGSIGSTILIVTLTLLRALGIEDPYVGITFATIIPIIFFCWGFGIWGFIRVGRIGNEIKYLDNIDMMKRMKE